MLNNLGNLANIAAVLGAVGGIAGYLFALSQAGHGRRNMLINSATLAGILALIGVFFSLALALPMAAKLSIAALVTIFGLALFIPAVVVAFDGEAQNRVVKKAEDSAKVVLFSFNEISGGKDIIKEDDLYAALKNDVFTREERRAIKDVIEHIHQAGHLVDTLRRKVFIPVPMSKVPVLPTVQVIEVYHITREDLAGYAARRRADW